MKVWKNIGSNTLENSIHRRKINIWRTLEVRWYYLPSLGNFKFSGKSQDSGRSMERIIIQAGILQNSLQDPCNVSRNSPASANVTRIFFMCDAWKSLPWKIKLHVDVFCPDCRLAAMGMALFAQIKFFVLFICIAFFVQLTNCAHNLQLWKRLYCVN